VAYLVYVVILGRHPENRYGWNSLGNQIGSSLERRERFVEGVRGATEEANLLASDHGDSAFGEKIEVSAGSRATSKLRVLGTENLRDLAAAVSREIEFMRQLRGDLQIWRVLVKGLDALEMLHIVAIHLGRVRQLMREKNATVHERLDVSQTKK
jgi:hypothetical protein